MRSKRWTIEQLRSIAKRSSSIRQIIQGLGLIPAGGNYVQVKKYLRAYKISVGHLKGNGWSRGLRGIGKPRLTLEEILVPDSDYQSFKLKKRLFTAGLKKPACELCGWSKRAVDGRLPLELDHMNGNRRDNRLENLRVLCPNCHSLQPTHRGRNQQRRKK